MAVLEVVVSPSPESPIMVNYAVGTDDDAGTDDADGADYAGGTSGTVRIDSWCNSRRIEIAITDDDDIEPTREVFTVVLEAPGAEAGYVLGSPTSVAVKIMEGVCDRTPQVRDEIFKVAGAGECADVEIRIWPRSRTLIFDPKEAAPGTLSRAAATSVRPRW